MKIVVAEKLSDAALALLREDASFSVITAEQMSNGLAAHLADADALIVRSAVQVDAALLEHAFKLRVIGRAGVGVDNIDTAAATAKGIVVMNTPGANAAAVAELTIALMLALTRQLPRANASLHAGKWEKKSLEGGELRGKTLGILGLGRIGQEVARRARAFGMELVAYDPFISPVVARENGARMVALEEFWPAADYITLHVGLSAQTEGLINATTLALMKPGARVINCARGELIVDADLAEAIRSGKIAGAALDVFEFEPKVSPELLALKNVVVTPHIGSASLETRTKMALVAADNVIALFEGRRPPTLINPEVLAGQTATSS